MARPLPFLFLLAALSLFAGCALNAQPRVAVLNFENATGQEEFAFLEDAVPEYLIASLSRQNDPVILERQDARVYGSTSPVQDPLTTRKWLARQIRQAHFFIAGSVSRLETNFIITARLCDAANGEVLPGTAITLTCLREEDIYPRVQNMAAFFASQLRRRGVQTPLGKILQRH